MKYALLLLLFFPFAVQSGPGYQDDNCSVFTGVLPEFTRYCPAMIQSGALAVSYSTLVYESFFDGMDIDLSETQTYTANSADFPGVMCEFVDTSGVAHASADWETSLVVSQRPSVRYGMLYRLSIQMYCHGTDIAPAGAPLINMSNRNIRAFMGDFPDMEGNRAAFGVLEDGSIRMRYGHSLLHNYMHVDDTLPPVALGENRTITTSSADYPEVSCTIVDEEGTVTESYDWTSTVEIQSQYDDSGRDHRDRVILDVVCK